MTSHAEGDPGIRQLAIEYHVRWALAATTFVFALFSLAAIPKVRQGEPSSVWPGAGSISPTTSRCSTAPSRCACASAACRRSPSPGFRTSS